MGQCLQLHKVYPICSREIFKLMYDIILLRFDSCPSFLNQIYINIILSQMLIPISCCSQGIHKGPPATGRFLLTPSHYLENSLRNSLWYLGSCIHKHHAPSFLVTSLHHWPSTKRLCVVFYFISSIHTP